MSKSEKLLKNLDTELRDTLKEGIEQGYIKTLVRFSPMKGLIEPDSGGFGIKFDSHWMNYDRDEEVRKYIKKLDTCLDNVETSKQKLDVDETNNKFTWINRRGPGAYDITFSIRGKDIGEYINRNICNDFSLSFDEIPNTMQCQTIFGKIPAKKLSETMIES